MQSLVDLFTWDSNFRETQVLPASPGKTAPLDYVASQGIEASLVQW